MISINSKFPIPINGMNGKGIGAPVSTAMNGAAKAITEAPLIPAYSTEMKRQAFTRVPIMNMFMGPKNEVKYLPI